MLKTILLGSAFALVSSLGFANSSELDNEKANQSFQGTVVLRVDQKTGEMSMVKVNNTVETKESAIALASETFQTVPQDKVLSELDREAGASSWYWYYPRYNYGYGYNYQGGYNYGYNPYYYSYGHCYNPWYSYSYGQYSYYYYNQYSYYW